MFWKRGCPRKFWKRKFARWAALREQAGVPIAGGDTKVVEHGKADGMYITTTRDRPPDSGSRDFAASVRPGDKVLLSGSIGDHGITILLARGELDLEADICSDTRSVLPLVEALVRAAGAGIRWMRDPTRGGVATSLNELARDCGLGVVLFEEKQFLCGMRCAALANCWDWIRCISRTRGNFSPWCPRNMRTRHLQHCTQRRAEKRLYIIGEVREQPAGTVLRDNVIWRNTRGRYAGGRSTAENLLDERWNHRRKSQAHIDQRLLTRNTLIETFFRTEAQRLAKACREMSERFLRGADLLAFGRGPYATDAQHVSVEFVHPVIVGKRALPALDLSCVFGPWLKANGAARRHGDGFRSAGGRSGSVGGARVQRAQRGAMTFALPGSEGYYFAPLTTQDPFMHQEMIEILYHTLWETVTSFRTSGIRP